MRTSIASALALALVLPPTTAKAGGWSREQQATMEQIIKLHNEGSLDQAVTLAQQQVVRTDASKGFRRAVAREGKAVAIKVFERDQATAPAAAVAALCVAVALMRTYQAELMESEKDRQNIPPEVTRLEALATTAAAPCAPAPPPPPPPTQPPIVAVKPVEPGMPGPTLEGPASPPQPRLGSQRSRVRVSVGAGLVTVGVGLLAGTTAVLVARRSDDVKIAAVGMLAVAEDRQLTAAENADVAVWDARYARLENTGKVLGTLAGLSILAGVLVLVMPPARRRGPQARLRPLGAGVLFSF